MRFVGLVTARGGSKRLPRKALLPCAGRPLIDWTIDAARDAAVMHEFVVSTDDHEIAEHSRSLGASVPFLRPSALAADDARSLDVVVHAIEAMGWKDEHVILLQPTSPTRTASDIVGACDLAATRPEASVLSVMRLDYPLSWLWRDDGQRRKLSHSCNLPPDDAPLFRPNGAIYLRRASAILEDRQLISEQDCLFYEMPKVRSVDVDTWEDLDLADRILRSAPDANERPVS